MHTFFLNAGHAEYLPGTQERHGPLTTWEVAFDPEWNEPDFDVAEDEQRKAVALLIAEGKLPAEFDGDHWDPTWQTVYRVEGTLLLDHAKDLDRFLYRDIACEPSGDDDTFDYWPSGARLAYEWACAIHAADGPDKRAEVIEVVKGVVDEKSMLDFDDVGVPEVPE